MKMKLQRRSLLSLATAACASPWRLQAQPVPAARLRFSDRSDMLAAKQQRWPGVIRSAKIEAE
jgi:hypothetical protein